MTLGLWKIEETEDEFKKINKNTPLPENIKSKKRRLEILCRYALASEMGIDAKKIIHTKNGKPEIYSSNQTISISHTKNYITILTGNDPYLGIDIETISDRILKIKDRFLTGGELKEASESNYGEKTSLILFWCAKEAIFKALSDEKINFKNDIKIYGLDKSTNKNGEFHGNSPLCNILFKINFYIEKDYILVFCTSK